MRIRINPVYGKELKMKVRSVKFALTIFLFNLMLGIVAITGFEVMFNMHLNPWKFSLLYFLFRHLQPEA